MRMKTIREAQERLGELVKEARDEAIGLTDEEGNVVGLLAGLSEDDLDELLVQTEAFQAMIARSRASLQSGVPVSAEELLKEIQEKLPGHEVA
jgi:ribosomal protein L12E/L44/L45/RPP1/RPP2